MLLIWYRGLRSGLFFSPVRGQGYQIDGYNPSRSKRGPFPGSVELAKPKDFTHLPPFLTPARASSNKEGSAAASSGEQVIAMYDERVAGFLVEQGLFASILPPPG